MAARKRAVRATSAEQQYIAWLMQNRRTDLQAAIAYAKTGAAGLAALRSRQIPRTKAEIETAREVDKPESLRRWERIDRPCPKRGCLYPVNHSGPHKMVRDFERSESLDEFDRRTAPLPESWDDAEMSMVPD